MCDRRRQPADSRQAVLAARSLFQRADLGQILEGDHHAAGLARFAKQGNHGKAQPQHQTVGCQAVGFKAWAGFAIRGGAHGRSDALRHVAEEDRSLLAAHFICLVAGNVLRGRVKGVDPAL